MSILNRQFILCMVMSSCVLICTTGCIPGWLALRGTQGKLPEVLLPDATLEQITSTINQNTSNAKQISSRVKLEMDGVPARLEGQLALEQPRNLRIEAGVLGISELGVDIGSNDEFFWVWSKAAAGGMEPVLLYARHEEFARSPAARSLPIQPQWIVQALGLIKFESTDNHQGPFPRDDGRLEIRSTIQSPRGMITRVVAVNRKSGVMEQLAFYDDQNQIIAFANAESYEYYEEQQVRLPRHVKIVFTDPQRNRIQMSISLGKFTVNNTWGDPALLWKMPRPTDVKTLDISRANLTSQNQPHSPGGTTPLGNGNHLPTRTAEPPRGYQYR